jgi:ABC-type phosphate transport system substrate-binding protein
MKNNQVVSLFAAVAILGIPIMVIVNAANPVDNLSLGELKKLFLSDRSRWDTGKAVAPVMPAPGTPERTSFHCYDRTIRRKGCGWFPAPFSIAP